MMSEASLQNILENYIYLRYENKVILEFLKQRVYRRLSGVCKSIVCVGEKLTMLKTSFLKNIIREEISGPGILRGYRAVWH